MVKQFVAALSLVFVSACTIQVPAAEQPASTPTETAPSVSSVDEAFLSVVREEIPSLVDMPDDVLIDSATTACGLLEDASPLTPGEFVAAVEGFAQGTGFMSEQDAAYFLGASAAAYCPSISQEIDRMLNSTL